MLAAASKRGIWQPLQGLARTNEVKKLELWSMGVLRRAMDWATEQWTEWFDTVAAKELHSMAHVKPCRIRRVPALLSYNFLVGLFTLFAILASSEAAFVNFTNCLPPAILDSSGNNTELQWVPLYVNAVFNETAPTHNLNITVYGNVTGRLTKTSLPPPNDPTWTNPNDTDGKIVDLAPGAKFRTTLKASINVLTFTEYHASPSDFCESTVNVACPIAPVFNPNFTMNQLPGFTIANNLYSDYAFTSLYAMVQVISGDDAASPLGCVAASITPELGVTISNLLTYLPLLVLVLVGIATASAAIFSPWGTTDIFRWTSNYGRDADQLRLITPGFGDCIQYIQFIVLSGSLSLDYPGFYQPVVSRVSWSALMFNESFVSHGPGTQSVVDGIYVANGIYGLDVMRQLVGMSQVDDVWAGMFIWLLVIIAALTTLIQIGFLGRWLYRKVSHTQEEDLRAKNMPFTVGNAIRVIFNYFLLPIVALSMFQLVVAGQSPAFTVALAALTVIALVFFAGWLLWLIAATRPRSYLFDDLPTVLLYGPLYNTYSDNTAAFALIPVMLTFLRGIAIGAVQPSGVAQLVLLAICEVVLILMLNAFRPFSSPTSMNIFHTLFAVVRLLTVMLMVAFVPSLNVADAPRGWIAYIILLLHGIVLFVGFFLHSLQTLTEVIARLAGAGDEDGGATRGGLVKAFGMRQLSRRNPRRAGRARRSAASDAAVLTQDDHRQSGQISGPRSRSLSASSAMLLNRRSVGVDSVSVPGGGGHSHTDSAGGPQTPTTPGGASYFSGGKAGSATGGIVNLKAAGAADPYYRPPRQRRVTMDLQSPENRSRQSWASGGWGKRFSTHSPNDSSPDPMEGPSISGRGTPLPAHLGGTRDFTDSDPEDLKRTKTDYATREVDYYYQGFRGPALSHMPTRKRKTGPADPTGPVSAATGWFQNFFGGKTKEKGKGFEVIRSARLPPNMQPPAGEIALSDQVPYRDDVDASAQTEPIAEKPRDFELEDEGGAVGAGIRHLPDSSPNLLNIDDEAVEGDVSEDENPSDRKIRISQFPPSLPNIDVGSSIGMPSRLNSRTSYRPPQQTSTSRPSTGGGTSGGTTEDEAGPPKVPRKSSKRTASYGSAGDFPFKDKTRLSVIPPSPPGSPRLNRQSIAASRPIRPGSTSQRIPFGSDLSPSRTLELTSSAGGSAQTTPLSEDGTGVISGHSRHSSSALGPYAAETRDDRPSSLGYVQKHRASENVHIVHPLQPPMAGSSAEVVDDPGRRSLTPESRP